VQQYAVLFATLKRTNLEVIVVSFARSSGLNYDFFDPYNLIHHTGVFLVTLYAGERPYKKEGERRIDKSNE